MNATAVAVTPAGQALGVWAERIAAAPRRCLDALVAEQDWSRRRHLLVLSAHPDDETLGCGRLVHAWSARGPVTALTMTAGEACVDHVLARPDGLAERRMGEWTEALAILGASARPSPRLPDGGLDRHEAGVSAVLGSWLSSESADEVVLAAPWRHDPHPDHAACGRMAAELAALHGVPLIEYPVWMTYWTDPDSEPARDLPLRRLDVAEQTEAVVERACAAFVTQLEPLAPELGPVVPAAMLRHQQHQLMILTPSVNTRTR